METLLSPALAGQIGLWAGLLMTLMIFSLLVGDNGLARLAQYVLVGAGLAYAVVLVWESVLTPRLLVPLGDAPTDWRLWIPLALGVLLLAAGLERTISGSQAKATRWRGLLQLLGALPLGLMMGVAVAVGMIGAFQGTLLPQFSRAVATGFQWTESPVTLATGVLGLLLTTGVIVHLRSSDDLLARQPAPLRGLLRGWVWLGRRGLWLAAGLLFARLLAARLSLLIAEFEFLRSRLEQLGLWQWVETFWRQLTG